MRALSLLLLAFAVVSCGQSRSPLEPGEIPAGLTARVETASIVFHHAPGDPVDPEWQQQYHEWATARLGVTLPDKLRYFKYRTPAELGAAVGESTNGWASPEALQIHTIWPRDDHESIHVYVGSQLGRPPSFFNEGIAVAFQVDPIGGRDWPMWNAQHVHAIARSHRRDNTLPSLTTLLDGDGFWDFDSRMTYPVAGSFVFFLIEEHGIEPIIEFCRRSGSRTESASTTKSRFLSVFGFSLEDAEGRWHEMLDGFSG